MANEKKQNGQEVSTEVTEAVANEAVEEKKLVIERKPIKDRNGKQMITQDGRLYFSYNLYGKLRGREVVAEFAPKDKGGYRPLDIVFDISPTAELIIEEAEQTESDGKKKKYSVYKIQNIDEDGVLWEATVKPSRGSDKDLLNMILSSMGLPRAI